MFKNLTKFSQFQSQFKFIRVQSMMMSQQEPRVFLKDWKEHMYAGINAKESELELL